jgi:hypothetical protein
MKLENRRQQVVPFRHFLLRLAKYAAFAAALIFFSVGLGVVGYHLFAKLGWLDSFHMACLILTGMGPVSEMTSTSAKVFDSFYALYSGVAFLSIVAVFFAPIIHRLLHILHVDDRD